MLAMVHRYPGAASRRTDDGAAAARRTVPRGRAGLAPSRVPVAPRAEETEAPSIVRKPRSDEAQEPGLAERRSERPLIAAPGSALHQFRERSTGPGQPLDVRTRASMERRHGKDFGRVRVHTEAAAPPCAGPGCTGVHSRIGDRVRARHVRAAHDRGPPAHRP